MILTVEQLRAAATGALLVRETDAHEVEFCRFSDAQKTYYKEGPREIFYTESFATSGVRLEFVTDSDHLTLSYHTKRASTRFYYYFDVTVDGLLAAHFGHEKIEEAYATERIDLPEGSHRICIYFPCLANAHIRSLELADGATFEPFKRPLKMLCYGDSITQGYVATYPSQSYVNLIADKLNAAPLNQGIGGERFCPGLLEDILDYTPDIITVAYGSNDWRRLPRQLATDNAYAFYAAIRHRYPDAKIFALTPIWRADNDLLTEFGKFEEARELVRSAAARVGAIVLEGDRMVPHVSEAYSDAYLHPNDFGFKCYAEDLFEQMLPYLEKETL